MPRAVRVLGWLRGGDSFKSDSLQARVDRLRGKVGARVCPSSNPCLSFRQEPTFRVLSDRALNVDGHFGTQNSERFVDHNIWGFRLSRRRSRAVSENVCGDAVRAASPA